MLSLKDIITNIKKEDNKENITNQKELFDTKDLEKRNSHSLKKQNT
jgi:hypothetical protein